MRTDCFECAAPIEGDTLEALSEAFLAHARSEHEWPYPDQAIRNYAEATQRLTGPSERLDEIGEIEVHRVTPERLDDWVSFFDHDAFVGTPEWAACYCLEPHTVPERQAGQDPELPADPHWRDQRAGMMERLAGGGAYGYLAYVGGRPAGWVNASMRSDYTLFASVEGADPEATIGVSCFIIAPPYRRHGVAGALLDRVIADAAARGASWIEGYPFNPELDRPVSFRGSRGMFSQRGFAEVQRRERDTVMRRAVS